MTSKSAEMKFLLRDSLARPLQVYDIKVSYVYYTRKNSILKENIIYLPYKSLILN